MNSEIRAVNMLISHCFYNNLEFKIETVKQSYDGRSALLMSAGKYTYISYDSALTGEFLIDGSVHLYARLMAENFNKEVK